MNDWKPGHIVWIIERDVSGDAEDIEGYIFLAVVQDAVIVSVPIYDSCSNNKMCNLEDTIAYRIEQEREWSNPGLDIFPADDCYLSKEEAQIAFEAETGEAW